MSDKTKDAPEVEPEEVEEEVDVDETDTDTDADTDDTDAEEEEVVSKTDLDKVQGALAKERETNKAKDKTIRELKKELKAATEQKPEDVDSQKLVAEADKRADKFRTLAVKKEAALALTEAKAKVKTDRLIKLLDLDDVEIDDNGNIDGLAEAIEELKAESPEFFRSDEDEEPIKTTKRPTVRKTGTVDAGQKTAPQPKPKGTAEMFKDQLFG